MKKVLICINNLAIGGAERLALDDANEMYRRGIDVVVVTLGTEPNETFLPQLQSKKKYINFPSLINIRSWIGLFNFILKEKPDLLITHLWYANTIGRIIGFLARVRVLSFEHNIYDNLKTKKMFFVDKILQYFCYKIVAVSFAVKENLVLHGIKQEKIDVLYNCINIEKYFQRKVEHEFFTYLFIGRLIDQKGVDVLIHAFSKNRENTRLVIVGAGGMKDELISQVRNLNLDSQICFVGTIYDIPQQFAEADCFVLPSRYEGLGIVIIEAMAAGTPIIVTDFSAGLELIQHEINGLVVPRDNPAALTDAMKRIKIDAVLREKLKNGALDSAKNFSIIKHVDGILEYISSKQ